MCGGLTGLSCKDCWRCLIAQRGSINPPPPLVHGAAALEPRSVRKELWQNLKHQLRKVYCADHARCKASCGSCKVRMLVSFDLEG